MSDGIDPHDGVQLSFEDERRQRLRNKLQRLKALAECPTGNPHETAAAAASMVRLMMEHRIEQSELDGPSEAPVEVVQEAFEGFRRYPKWEETLFAIVAKANDCYPFVMKRGRLKKLQIIGTKDDIADSCEVFTFLQTALARLEKAWARTYYPCTSERTDFKWGGRSSYRSPPEVGESANRSGNPDGAYSRNQTRRRYFGLPRKSHSRSSAQSGPTNGR